MSEKSYGQIGEEAYQGLQVFPVNWEDLDDEMRESSEAAAQAVIAEYRGRSPPS